MAGYTWAVCRSFLLLSLATLALLTLLRREHTRRDRDFFVFALTFGLSQGMHISDLGFAPALAVFLLLTDRQIVLRRRWWLAGLVGFGLQAAQYGWIRLQISRLDPRLPLSRIPAGLAGLYAHTLGSFSDLRFAFPVAGLPERLVVDLYDLCRELGPLATLVGFGGLVTLMLRQPRHLFLLVGMYLVHMWIFIQYRAFDLEGFVLPAHLPWAIFVAFGAAVSLGALRRLPQALFGTGRLVATAGIGAAGLLLVSTMVPMLGHWQRMNRSDDVAINDICANVWEALPADLALHTPGGVSGHDTWYRGLIYDTRPGVLLPVPSSRLEAVPDLRGRELCSSASR